VAFEPQDLDISFDAPIGVQIKGETSSCVELPGSKEIFGTGKSVKVVGTVDGLPLTSAFMPTGSGGHMVSISAKLRKQLGKDVGDTVTIRLKRRLS